MVQILTLFFEEVVQASGFFSFASLQMLCYLRERTSPERYCFVSSEVSHFSAHFSFTAAIIDHFQGILIKIEVLKHCAVISVTFSATIQELISKMEIHMLENMLSGSTT